MIKFLDLDFVKISKPKLKILLRKVASEKHYIINRVEYNFISANKMKEINKEFLDHDDITDIITFDYTDGNKVSAEVFISKEALLKNAAENSQSAEDETVRLLSHGLLHCLGYKDKTKKEKEIMRGKEEEAIKMFHVKPMTLDV
tara:strand:- start:309 stop:740 length:432 start_codon:yes stop_codon:yes gene_type:complete